MKRSKVTCSFFSNNAAAEGGIWSAGAILYISLMLRLLHIFLDFHTKHYATTIAAALHCNSWLIYAWPLTFPLRAMSAHRNEVRLQIQKAPPTILPHSPMLSRMIWNATLTGSIHYTTVANRVRVPGNLLTSIAFSIKLYIDPLCTLASSSFRALGSGDLFLFLSLKYSWRTSSTYLEYTSGGRSFAFGDNYSPCTCSPHNFI